MRSRVGWPSAGGVGGAEEKGQKATPVLGGVDVVSGVRGGGAGEARS